MKVASYSIGPDFPSFIIAEIANNHDQNKELAIELIRTAAKAGVQAVKFQTFSGLDIASAEQLSSDYNWPAAQKYKYWHEYLDTIMLPFDWYEELIELTHSLNLAFIATPCSVERAEFLVEAGTDALKIASMDNNNTPFLEVIGKMNIPVIMSTGMAEQRIIDEAMEALRYPKRDNLALLHCVSKYPTKPEDMSLLSIKELQERYDLPIGFSDHSLHNYGTFAAVSLGAKIVEKHLTTDRSLEGPDHFFSLLAEEFTDLVRGIRAIEAGLVTKETRSDLDEKKKMYRSIHIACDLPRGTVLDKGHLEIKRPDGGLEPKYFREVLGKTLRRGMKAFDPLFWEDLE